MQPVRCTIRLQRLGGIQWRSGIEALVVRHSATLRKMVKQLDGNGAGTERSGYHQNTYFKANCRTR
jgi:hypothetical protein